jgi:hypothetical protein
MTESYYISIKSANLAHYFDKGYISPAKYYSNRIEDIQDKVSNNLLLSNIKFTNETNCCIEVAINSANEAPIQISENFFVFDRPLPVSRIKGVFFEEEKQRVNTVFNITSGAAFLPLELIKVDSKSLKIDTNQLIGVNIDIPKNDWFEKIDKFNRLLGGFAFMRIGGQEFQNYSPNYFLALSLVNLLIKDEISNQAVEVSNNYEWAVKETDKHSGYSKAIHSKLTPDIVERFAENDNIKLSRSNGSVQLDRIPDDKNTYSIAILASYGQNARKSIDDFISDFKSNKFSEKRKEGLSLSFGINKGYDAFRKDYKTANFDVVVKFRLDSQLDYYTIESIYQFVFNGKTDNTTFPYIDSWCPRLKEKDSIPGFETYQILDKTIISKKKSETKSFNSLQNIFHEVRHGVIYEKIAEAVNRWLPPFVQNRNITDGAKYFEDLLEKDFQAYNHVLLNRFKEYFDKKLIEESYRLKSENDSIVIKLKTDLIQKEGEVKELQKRLNQIDLGNSYSSKGTGAGKPSKSKTGVGVNAEHRKIEDTGVLFPVSESESPKDIERRRTQLKKMTLSKLKEEAQKKGLASNDLESPTEDQTDQERLIEFVLRKEFNL